MEIAVLAAQAVATASIAAWLTLGARDNLLFPKLNETYTAEVMSMSRMRAEFPDEFKQVAHRAVTNPKVQRSAFRLVLLAELLVCLLLWLGAFGLLLEIFGVAPQDSGRQLALFGATGFTAIWAGFLVIGNHFCYWFCHEGAQNTHYQMTLWGLGTMIILTAG